jgi:anti-sigma factor RsiW
MDDLKAWIRYRDGEFEADELNAFERRLGSDAGFRARVEYLEGIADTLGEGADASFRPGFAARVMERVTRSETSVAAESMYEALRWIFPRLAAACVVVILAVGAYSAFQGGYGGSVLDAMLGLPEATLATALTIGG